MKVLLILWAIGLVASDKLDRTYLPPPGSSLSGGSSESLDLPLEVPKEIYPSTLGPETGISDGSSLQPNYPNVAFGIDRQGPTITSSSSSVTTGPSTSFPNNLFNLPTTTTSYAFTQTTTLSPVEGFETTAGPFNTVSQGFPISSVGPTSDYTQYLNQQIFNTPQPFNPGFSSDTRIPVSEPEFSAVQSLTNYSYSSPQYGPSSNQQNQYPTNQEISNGQAIVNLQNLIPDGFPNMYSPSTQYGSDLDGIPGVMFPSSEAVYPDVYIGHPDSASYRPNSYQGNRLTVPELRGNYDGQIQSQGGYTTTDTRIPSTLSPVQYTGDTTPGSIASLAAVSSSPIYSANQKNINPQYNGDIRPERVQSEADRNAIILNYENVLTPEGFAYTFDTSNGIHVDESGTATDGVKAQGSYSYIGDDGQVYRIVYTADENGYRPQGDHLPTAPPVPEAILKVIEEAEKNRQLGIVDDGSYDDSKYGHSRYQGLKDRISQVDGTGGRPGNFKNNLNRKPTISTVGETNSNNAGFPHRRIVGTDDGNSYKGEDGVKSPKEDNKSYDAVAKLDKDERAGDMSNSPPILRGQLNTDDNSGLVSDITKSSYPQETKDLNANEPDSKLTNTFSNTRRGPSSNSKVLDYSTDTSDQNQLPEEGYQYTRPGTKFNSIDMIRNHFPSRSFDNTEGTESEVDEERTSLRPFMTPNVSFNYQKKDDEDSSESLSPAYGEKIISQDQINDNVPAFYNTNFKLNRDQDKAFGGSKFDGPRPTAAGPYKYQTPYTSSSRVQPGQTYNYRTSTLGNKYAPSTTPMPSEFSSRAPAKSYGVNYPGSTLEPKNLGPGRLSVSSRRPSYSTVSTPGSNSGDDPIISTERSGIADGIRDTTYRGRLRKPVRIGEGQQSVQEVGRVRPSEEGLKSKYGISEPSFQSRQFGVQSTTPKIIGEDFSGPGQPQRFDPETGYYY